MPDPADNANLELVEKAVAGDAFAYRDLIEREGLRIRMTISQLAGRTMRADFDEEDCFQTVVAEAWQSLHQFEARGGGSFFAWMRTLIRNCLVDRARYLAAKSRHRGDARDSTRVREPLDPQTSVATFAARKHDYAVVRSAMNRMNESDRRLVELYYVEDLPIRELAAQVDLAPSTAFERLERALGQLRRELDDGK